MIFDSASTTRDVLECFLWSILVFVIKIEKISETKTTLKVRETTAGILKSEDSVLHTSKTTLGVNSPFWK